MVTEKDFIKRPDIKGWFMTFYLLEVLFYTI